MTDTLLHDPARCGVLLSLEDHAVKAAGLARAMRLALREADLSDPRDAAALQSLACDAADYTSA
ncbi:MULTISPECIES: hypothetical protein [Methylocystis]|uniref:Uncharacterized protein n=1 Tax=Methylocystis iwaonis TaxID=2885079 RepID=A0ABM8EEP1_9HYPH|nr:MULTISPECIES: hypothetical protein [Methylocystis]MDJ0450935.1 hypothetical protein [Methylocystis sp. JR02]BDV36526.1 hypothetical protein SS37A_40560 [Methylocystis iwaonis]